MYSLALILRHSDGRPIAWCIVGIFVGIYLFIKGFLLLQRRKLILNTPVSKVRSAPLGLVEISGLAVGPYTITAPITERSCYFHRTVAWEWKQQGRSKTWVKVATECNHVPFFIDDNTGKVMVDPRRAELDLHRDFQQEFCDGFFTTKEEAPPNVNIFLSRHGINTTNKIKVEEFCIKPKNALFLLGTIDENPGLELSAQPVRDEDEAYETFAKVQFTPSNVFSFLNRSRADEEPSSTGELLTNNKTYRAVIVPDSDQRSTQVVRLTPEAATNATAAMTQQQKIAAALVKAGISTPAAWSAAGVAPDGKSIASSTNTMPHVSPPLRTEGTTAPAAEGFDARPAVVIKKGKNNPTFMISWRSQREVARSLGWKCSLMIWGGPALTLLCLYFLQTLTHWF
ncbi:MAG: GIDE domain-containing protein [Candidatus Sulfotelmatobacter sp.]